MTPHGSTFTASCAPVPSAPSIRHRPMGVNAASSVHDQCSPDAVARVKRFGLLHLLTYLGFLLIRSKSAAVSGSFPWSVRAASIMISSTERWLGQSLAATTSVQSDETK